MLLMPLIGRIWNELQEVYAVARQRRELGRLSEHLLKDIGLSQVDAQREAERPFWDRGPSRDQSLRVRGHHRRDTLPQVDDRRRACCPQG